MLMENITSRKNQYIIHLRSIGSDSAYRHEMREFLCDGVKTLREALQFGAEISSVLWKGEADEIEGLHCQRQFTAPQELFDYASPMKNSPGPLFTVREREEDGGRARNAVILETVQDPGNVGTVIRSANAFNIGCVVLTGQCADLYSPKTVRSTMGAIFRQPVIRLELEELPQWLEKNGLTMYGAALSDKAADARDVKLSEAAVAVGSEGRGLSRRLLDMCAGEIIIPMNPESESLNAAVAASVLMWEMFR